MIQPRAWFCTVHGRHDRTCTRSCSAKSIDRTGSGKGGSEWWRPTWRAGAAAFLQGAGAGMHACARPLFHTRCSAVRADCAGMACACVLPLRGVSVRRSHSVDLGHAGACTCVPVYVHYCTRAHPGLALAITTVVCATQSALDLDVLHPGHVHHHAPILFF
jgi:hypothetical protein